MEDLVRYQGLHGRGRGGRVHVEIEGFFPHGRQENGVAGLAHVFLSDLQLDGLVGFLQRAE